MQQFDPPLRKPGRPKGSRSKTKFAKFAIPGGAEGVTAVTDKPRETSAEHSSASATVPPSAPLPTDTTSLLEYHHKRLSEIRGDLHAARQSPGTLPRDLSPFLMAEDRTLKAIGELTGAFKITEAKIVASDAWRTMFSEIVMILGKYPDARAALKSYFGSLSPQDKNG